jgi:outer membrane protein assembly factor BamD
MRKFSNSFFSTAILALLTIALTISSCGGGSESSKPEAIQDNAAARFQEGKVAFEKENYQDAIRIFEEIRIQAPTSSVAAEAAYLQGLSRFRMESYSAAAVDFRSVRRNYAGNPLASRAQYMVGESYFEMSPKAELDQTYALHALNEYQIFLRDFPKADQSLVDSAQTRMREIRSKLAHKVLLAAELYVKTEEYKSAVIYFERVLDQFYDSEYAPEAQLRLAELAYQRKKNDEAKIQLQKFEDKYLGNATDGQRQRARSLKANLS